MSSAKVSALCQSYKKRASLIPVHTYFPDLSGHGAPIGHSRFHANEVLGSVAFQLEHPEEYAKLKAKASSHHKRRKNVDKEPKISKKDARKAKVAAKQAAKGAESSRPKKSGKVTQLSSDHKKKSKDAFRVQKKKQLKKRNK